METIKDFINWGTESLLSVSPSAQLDAQILLAFTLKCERVNLITEPKRSLSENERLLFKENIGRRVKGEPVAYITGVREFWGLEFKVSPDVLIPRPETELLVEEGLKKANEIEGSLQILDLGTGSGCIAISLVKELSAKQKLFRCVAVDKSEGALKIAKTNAASHGVADKIDFRLGNWTDTLNSKTDLFDIVLSNPPYVGEGENVSPETKFEPQQALYAFDDGLADVKHLLLAVPPFIKPGGIFICEFGGGKRAALENHIKLSNIDFNYQFLGDLESPSGFTVLKIQF